MRSPCVICQQNNISDNKIQYITSTIKHTIKHTPRCACKFGGWSEVYALIDPQTRFLSVQSSETSRRSQSTTKFAKEQSVTLRLGLRCVVLVGIGGLVFRYLSSSKCTQALSQPNRPQ